MKSGRNKKKYLAQVKMEVMKSAAFLAVASMIFGTIGSQTTFAYFDDTATIEGNIFSAGTLILNLDSTSTFSSDLLYNGDSQTVLSNISNGGSLDFNYVASTTLVGTDNSSCGYIEMSVSGPNGYSYNGSIKDFNSSSTTQTMATSSNADWNYTFKVKSDAPASVWGKTCFFKWNYTAWQTNLPDSSLGFSSVEEKLGQINIGKAVVMNEILPNPEGLDTQLGLQGEWIEIYNNSNLAFDLSGWKIKDAANNTKVISSSNAMNKRTVIGAKGSGLEWVVVFMNDGILNNDGDTVSFYDSSNNLIDQYSYVSSTNDTDDSDSNSTGNGSNSNPSGSETAGNEGKSYARIPDGIGEWVDPVPTPGEPNILTDNDLVEDVNELLLNLSSTTEETGTSTATTTEAVAATTSASTCELAASSTESVIIESEEGDTSATSTEEIIVSSEEETETLDSSEEVVEDENSLATDVITEETPDIEIVQEKSEDDNENVESTSSDNSVPESAEVSEESTVSE